MRTGFVLGLIASVAVGVGPVMADTWNPLSRSAHNAFLADIDSIAVVEDVTSIRVATVPLTGAAGDYSHSVEVFQFHCATGEWRTAGIVEYGADGAETGAYPEEGAAWEKERAGTQPVYIKAIACEGARASPPHWPTIKAFIDAGRS